MGVVVFKRLGLLLVFAVLRFLFGGLLGNISIGVQVPCWQGEIPERSCVVREGVVAASAI